MDFRTKKALLSQMTPCERFWFKVAKGDGCWLWLGLRHQKGYGLVHATNKAGRSTTRPAHRIAYEFTYGPIPDGLMACHHCDNKPCVRPDHLFLGTAVDNARDARDKGRLRVTRLTLSQVTEIRELRLKTDRTVQDIAIEFGVGEGTISRILRNRTWKPLHDIARAVPAK